MTLRRVFRTTLPIALILSLVAATASSSSAATLAPTAGFKMSSVSIVGDDIFWFQRVSSPRAGQFALPPEVLGDLPPDVLDDFTSTDSPGRVLHRKLGSPKVSVVFKPSDNMAIAGFVARAGRVAVGLTNMDDKPRSSIVELTRNGETWSAKAIVERVGGEIEGRCDAEVRLLNIDSDARLVFTDEVTEGYGGKCELRRQRTVVKRTKADGTIEELGTSRSGWTLDTEGFADTSMRAGPGPWYARAYFDGGGMSSYNIETDETFLAPLMVSSLGRVEVTDDGRILRQAFTERKRRFYMLSRSAQTPQDNAILHRAGHVTWFHLCGSKVLEIARSRKPRKRGGGRFWYLYLRGLDGTVERRLPGRFPRGTTFNGCTADTALFSRKVRKQRVRQVAVPLAG